MRAIIALSLLVPLADAALAQAARPDRASGPTLRDFWSDLSAWGAAHPGVVIALAVVAATVIGAMIFNRLNRQP